MEFGNRSTLVRWQTARKQCYPGDPCHHSALTSWEPPTLWQEALLAFSVQRPLHTYRSGAALFSGHARDCVPRACPAFFPDPGFQGRARPQLACCSAPSFCCSGASCPARPSAHGPRAPFPPLQCVGPLAAVPFLQDFVWPHSSQALSSFFSWSFSLFILQNIQPWIQQAICISGASPSWIARERHTLRLIGYYQSKVSNLRRQWRLVPVLLFPGQPLSLKELYKHSSFRSPTLLHRWVAFSSTEKIRVCEFLQFPALWTFLILYYHLPSLRRKLLGKLLALSLHFISYQIFPSIILLCG